MYCIRVYLSLFVEAALISSSVARSAAPCEAVAARPRRKEARSPARAYSSTAHGGGSSSSSSVQTPSRETMLACRSRDMTSICRPNASLHPADRTPQNRRRSCSNRLLGWVGKVQEAPSAQGLPSSRQKNFFHNYLRCMGVLCMWVKLLTDLHI